MANIEISVQEAELMLQIIDELDTRPFFTNGLERRAFANSLHGRINQAKMPIEKVEDPPKKEAELKEGV